MTTKDIVLLILGIFGGVVSTFIGFLIKNFWFKLRSDRSKLSGEWVTRIYESGREDPLKIDILDLKHNPKTGEIKGTIKRNQPEKQKHREWIFKGVFTKNAMLVVFWSKKDLNSYGVEYLVMVDDYKYEGYYLKNVKGSIEKIRIVNEKREID